MPQPFRAAIPKTLDVRN